MPNQRNVVCYNYNKSNYIAKFYRRKNVNRKGLTYKNKNV